MSTVRIRDKEFSLLLSDKEIQKRIIQIARDIRSTNFQKPPLLVGVMNGSFRFASDLIREMDYPVQVEFLKLKSYRRMQSTGKVNMYSSFGFDVRNQDVIIIEDIVDTGNTLDFLIPLLKADEPDSIRVASLLYKPKAYLASYNIDYVGFEIEDEFVVGYGLDYDGLGRELNEIYQLKI